MRKYYFVSSSREEKHEKYFLTNIAWPRRINNDGRPEESDFDKLYFCFTVTRGNLHLSQLDSVQNTRRHKNTTSHLQVEFCRRMIS